MNNIISAKDQYKLITEKQKLYLCILIGIFMGGKSPSLNDKKQNKHEDKIQTIKTETKI